MTLEEMMEKEGFSTPEKVLVQNVGAPDIRYSNAATILAAKKYGQAIDKLIVSNEKLGKSNNNYSKTTIRLTVVIAFTAFLNILTSVWIALEERSTALFIANKMPVDFLPKGNKLLTTILVLFAGLTIYTGYVFRKHW